MNLFYELFDKRSLYFDAFDRMTDAVYICDIHKKIVYINKAAEKLDGYLLKDVKGKFILDLYGLDNETSPTIRAMEKECPVINEEFTYYVNGKEVIQLCNAGPIYDEGKLVGAYSIQRDMTLFKDIVEKNISLQRVINRQKSRDPISTDDLFSGIVGGSEVFQLCISQARQAAKTDSALMLIGSTGSGKEVFAHAVHNGSNRKDKPFLALNCAAIPETLIESILFGTVKGVFTGAVEKEGILAQADGGTVFLDEINSMPLTSQAKLLRVLEEKRIMKLGSNKEVTIDIRVISSTNELPTEAIRNGHLREDLFYRLSVIQIVIPPLRDRKEDIPDLVGFFINKYNKRFEKKVLGIDQEVMSCFMDFQWPGNVRQLKTCIESAMNFAEDGGKITLSDLPYYVFEDTEVPENRYRQRLVNIEQKAKSEKDILNIKKESQSVAKSRQDHLPQNNIRKSIYEEEREMLISAIQAAKGNVAKAARSLGISRQLMYYRLKKYKIE